MKKLLKTYPSWIYNSLAYIYLGAGLLAMVVLPNAMGAFSGILLVLAGGTVWTLRYKYRKEFTHYAKHLTDSTAIDTKDLPNEGLVQMSWSEAYECGHPVIDGQHRRLFGLANEAIQTLLEKQPKPIEEALLNKIAVHMTEHFHTEEDILFEVKDASFVEHQKQHRALLDRSALLMKKYHENQLDQSALVAFLADEVIEGHILKEDFPWPKTALPT